jgi:hypothetical protein
MADTPDTDIRPWWRRLFARIKRVAEIIGRPVQRAVLLFLLVLLYVFVVGVTFLYAQVFKRRLMTARARPGATSCFLEARDYTISLEGGRHGS